MNVQQRNWKSHIRTVALGLAVAAFGVGCAKKGLAGIPNSAEKVASGRGEVTYKATDPGEVFVYDEDAKKILYSGLMSSGETLTVNPDDDLITIGVRTVAETQVDDDHRYRVYLRRP